MISVTEKDQSRDSYEEICRQNGQINKFAKFYVIYCCTAPFSFCIPSISTSYMRYFAASGNDSDTLQFELPMEQKYGKLPCTNIVIIDNSIAP